MHPAPAASTSILQAILDYAPVGIWLLEPDGRLTFVNRTFCQALGVSEERFLAATHYSELYDEATARSCMASDAEALARPGAQVSRERLRFSDGLVHDVEIVKARLDGPGGGPVGVIGISMDVTARCQAEAAAAHQLEGYRLLNGLAAMPGLDVQAQIRQALRIGVAHLGLEAGAVLRCAGQEAHVEVQVGDTLAAAEGQTLRLEETLSARTVAGGAMLTFRDLASAPQREWLAGLRAPVAAFLGVALRVGGKPYGAIELSAKVARPAPFEAADLEFTSLLARWVEAALERQEAVSRLRASQGRLAGIIDSAMDAIVSFDERLRVVVFNGAAEAVFGCSAADALGSSVDRFLPERFREDHRDKMSRFIRTGQTERSPHRLANVVALRASGQEFRCEASISRAEVDGAWLSTVILRDTTERDAAEEARRVIEARTEQAQRLEALGTLAGGIAHDFNNVLHVILMNAEQALESAATTPEVAESLASIRGAGERARDLVRRILSFSRRQPIHRSVIDLRPTLEETVRFMRAVLPAGVRFSALLAPHAPAVLADSTEIQQVAMNLCGNAWQALGGLGGSIELRLDEVAVAPGAAPGRRGLAPGRYARLTVSDTGPGMDEATRSRIFEPFFTTKALGEGTGLGLSQVHGIVTQAGGVIEVTSSPGQGATFEVYLPAARTAEASRSGQAAGGRRTGSGELVLLVDDEELLVRAVSQALVATGYRVESYVRPAAALAALREAPERYAVVLSDMNMPGMTGLELVSSVRDHATGLPAIIMSGNLMESESVQADALGCEVLSKPCSSAELCAAVAAALRRRSAGGPAVLGQLDGA